MSDKKTEVVEDTEDKKTASKLSKKKKEIGQILFGLLQKINHNISSPFMEIKQ